MKMNNENRPTVLVDDGGPCAWVVDRAELVAALESADWWCERERIGSGWQELWYPPETREDHYENLCDATTELRVDDGGDDLTADFAGPAFRWTPDRGVWILDSD